MAIVLDGTANTVTPLNGALGGTTPSTVAATTISASGVSTFSAGTAATPAITTTGDTNTGIFFPAADTIAFSEGGTERMRLDSNGNLGLGVTPSATWSSAARAIQLGGFNSIFGYTSNVFRLANNAIFTSANETYGASSIGATYYQQYNGIHSWYTAPSGTAGNAITFTQAMTLDASGNLGIGTASPVSKLDVEQSNAKSSTSSWQFNVGDLTSQATGVGGGITFSGYKTATSAQEYFAAIDSYKENSTAGNAAGALRFHTQVAAGSGLVERMRIDTSGNVLIGTASKMDGGILGLDISASTTTGITLGLSGVAKAYLFMAGASATNFETASGVVPKVISGGTNGVTLTNGATAWSAISDERKKDIIEPITDAITKVSSLRTVIGKYKTEEDGVRRVFLIAQDVQAVLPEAVDTEEDEDNTLSLRYTDLIPLLIAGFKEQQALITSLTARLEVLEAK